MNKFAFLITFTFVLASLWFPTKSLATQDPRCYTTINIPTNAAREGRMLNGTVTIKNVVEKGSFQVDDLSWKVTFSAGGNYVSDSVTIKNIRPNQKETIPIWVMMNTKESVFTVTVTANNETTPCAKQSKKIYRIPAGSKNVPIYSVTPNPVRVGDTITITGWGFADMPARRFVVFDDAVTYPRQPGEIVSWTNTKIVVKIPQLKYPTLTRSLILGYYLKTMPNGFEDFALANSAIKIVE